MLKQIFIVFIMLIFQINYAHSNQTMPKEPQGERQSNLKKAEANMITVTDYDGNQYATVKKRKGDRSIILP